MWFIVYGQSSQNGHIDDTIHYIMDYGLMIITKYGIQCNCWAWHTGSLGFSLYTSYAKSSTSEYNAKPERQRTNLANDACFGAPHILEMFRPLQFYCSFRTIQLTFGALLAFLVSWIRSSWFDSTKLTPPQWPLRPLWCEIGHAKDS